MQNIKISDSTWEYFVQSFFLTVRVYMQHLAVGGGSDSSNSGSVLFWQDSIPLNSIKYLIFVTHSAKHVGR